MSTTERAGSPDLPQLPDFRKIFFERLESIYPFTEEQGKEFALELNAPSLGITQIKRKALAIVFPTFVPGLPKIFNLWIEDPITINEPQFAHFEVSAKLEKFWKGARQISSSAVAAEIIQDHTDKLYLLSSPNTAESIQSKIEERVEEGRSWINLMEFYNISKLVGNFQRQIRNNDLEKKLWETGIIVDIDVLGKQREDRYLNYYAQRHNMTITQFMRFRSFVLSAKDADRPVNWDDIAKEV